MFAVVEVEDGSINVKLHRSWKCIAGDVESDDNERNRNRVLGAGSIYLSSSNFPKTPNAIIVCQTIKNSGKALPAIPIQAESASTLWHPKHSTSTCVPTVHIITTRNCPCKAALVEKFARPENGNWIPSPPYCRRKLGTDNIAVM
jgi:hypothetical protein